ncbi:hypothetical protein MKX83_22625 [Cytobacillus sp. FSL M8-0252]|uniref:hypothetical protein n=1 Tax=Cytobacillus sp. FSL M8-0252 TaxID=2921621 RepID=UPI0030F63612
MSASQMKFASHSVREKELSASQMKYASHSERKMEMRAQLNRKYTHISCCIFTLLRFIVIRDKI